jgi:hypothetical protein
MMLVVAAMFWKGVEVLGRGENNYSIEYKGPKKTIEQRWQDAYDWQKERKAND